jgi:site-specific DNA-methyltransferase (adenine-specific)
MGALSPYNIYQGRCEELIPRLPNCRIGCVVTSPPYASQRKKFYDSINEQDYPEWIAGILSQLWPKLTDDGSVLINIRPHIRNGCLSDYVLRSRLAIRAAGYVECEELIWHKPDAPPLGSKTRPRRTWESVLWFSKARQPWIDLKAAGRESNRIGYESANRFGISKTTKQNQRGIARVSDVIRADINTLGRERVNHPAMYPIGLPTSLVQTYAKPGTIVCDPFAGSGQTCLAAQQLGRPWIGFDSSAEYVEMARKRLRLNARLAG